MMISYSQKITEMSHYYQFSFRALNVIFTRYIIVKFSEKQRVQQIIRRHHQKLRRGFALRCSIHILFPVQVTAALQTELATAAMGALPQSGAGTRKMSTLFRIPPETKLIMLYYCKPRNI